MTKVRKTKLIKFKARRLIWNSIRRLPKWIRRRIVRAQFDAEYSLPSNIILKQAETQDELEAAFKIVHDAYVDLNYMSPADHGLRFNKYLALSSTVVFVVKDEDEVVGTMSIIQDSHLGLPVEATWDLSYLRKQGLLVGEIAALAIKKSHKLRRGRLLLPLCKIMYEYSTQLLKLDAIVIATSSEVEPFYTDLLLFEKLKLHQKSDHKMNKAVPHAVANGNPSIGGVLFLKESKERYRLTYDHLSVRKNLYHFFVNYRMPNILPYKSTQSIHALLNEKNEGLLQIIEKVKSIAPHELTVEDLKVIESYQLKASSSDKELVHRNRIQVRHEVLVISKSIDKVCKGLILDISKRGVQIKFIGSSQIGGIPIFASGDPVDFLVSHEGQPYLIEAQVRWNRFGNWLGCEISQKHLNLWSRILEQTLSELRPKNDSKIEPTGTVVSINKNKRRAVG